MINEIVVLSGKGGTGKTSIAASLAVLAGYEAVIADCDVDAANMHIILKPDFAQKIDFYSGELAVIDQDLCTICGKCAAICRFNAIPLIGNEYRIDALSCEGCGYCERICPTKAITMVERKSGQVFISQIKVGSTMVHARLDIGAENSGKLVARVKNDSKSLATKLGKQFIIVDGSPGIGCPVISSLAGANFVLLVTEPTVSGLHDLKRISGVIKKFRIKMACIINKHDINTQKTEEIMNFLSEEKIWHLANIPYDVGFTKAMSEAKSIVEIDSPIKPMIEEIWAKLKEGLTKN